jgi:uncharacterized protein
MRADEDGPASLIAAVIADNIDLVQVLLEKGVEANCHEDPALLRPLHFAALYNSPGVIPLLVMAGADVAALTDCDDTPLNIAKRHGYKQVIAVLNKHAAIGSGANRQH